MLAEPQNWGSLSVIHQVSWVTLLLKALKGIWVCLLLCYDLATFKVISGWVTINAEKVNGDQAILLGESVMINMAG